MLLIKKLVNSMSHSAKICEQDKTCYEKMFTNMPAPNRWIFQNFSCFIHIRRFVVNVQKLCTGCSASALSTVVCRLSCAVSILAYEHTGKDLFQTSIYKVFAAMMMQMSYASSKRRRKLKLKKKCVHILAVTSFI